MRAESGFTETFASPDTTICGPSGNGVHACALQLAASPSSHHQPFMRTPFAKPGPAYFSLRQFTEPRFSTLEDSIWMSKPLRSRYLSMTTWPVPSSETP